MQHHADLLTRAFWQARKQRILDGHIEDVFPYPQPIRFCNQTVATNPAESASLPVSPPYLENHHNE